MAKNATSFNLKIQHILAKKMKHKMVTKCSSDSLQNGISPCQIQHFRWSATTTFVKAVTCFISNTSSQGETVPRNKVPDFGQQTGRRISNLFHLQFLQVDFELFLQGTDTNKKEAIVNIIGR